MTCGTGLRCECGHLIDSHVGGVRIDLEHACLATCDCRRFTVRDIVDVERARYEAAMRGD